MLRNGSQVVGPDVVSQRLCDLLMSFPAACIGGVQWETLRRKYKERHSSHLDIATLGHTSALVAATSLLWDVLRVADSEDTDNPVLAIEDDVAMTPRPGRLATWPSLYMSFCELVQQEGTPDSNGENQLLLSQLKPLLQAHWHSSFNECGLSYFSREGTAMQLKKMKHLVQAVLRWRAEYIKSREGCSRRTSLDEILALSLELVPSTKHNDLVLRRVLSSSEVLAPASVSLESRVFADVFHDHKQGEQLQRQHPQQEQAHQQHRPQQLRQDLLLQTAGIVESDVASDAGSRTSSSRASRISVESLELERELAFLRAENTALRTSNELLMTSSDGSTIFNQLFRTPSKGKPFSEPDVFDDPFEPPPEALFLSSVGTRTPSEWGLSSGSITPGSGMATPVVSRSTCPGNFAAGLGMSDQLCALVPMWFSLGDRTPIPSGIVSQAKSLFERSNSIPSWFVEPNFRLSVGR